MLKNCVISTLLHCDCFNLDQWWKYFIPNPVNATDTLLYFSKTKEKKKNKKLELGNEGKKGYYLLCLRREYACVQFASVI